MKNKSIYIGIGVLGLVLIAFFAGKSQVAAPSPEEERGDTTTATSSKTPVSSSKKVQTDKAVTTGTTKTTTASAAASLPEMDFLDKRMVFPLKDLPDVKINIEKVVFGRGDSIKSSGCSGIPNANFSTYFYPGAGTCIGETEVDGAPLGIVSFHILVNNNGNIAFGGNSDALKLNYIRSGQSKFAYPLLGLSNYYINGYSSKEIVLSYLVPEDQLTYTLLYGYKNPSWDQRNFTSLQLSANALALDFKAKTLKILK